MKEVTLMFYKTIPSEENIGLKNVLWEISDTEGNLTHDWGFGNWDGKEWGAIPTPEGYTAKVAYWANTVDPELILKEKSKIIRLG